MPRKFSKNPDEKMFSFFLRVINFIKKNVIGIYRANIFELDLKNPGDKVTSELDLSFRCHFNGYGALYL